MSTRSDVHPPDDRLRAFHGGKLDQGDIPAVERHVNDCANCRQFLDDLPPDDVTAALRAAGRPTASVLAGHPRYKVGREIGRGGMGVVYEAEDLHMPGRRVAIKIIDPGKVADPAAVARFREEVKAAAKLGHHPPHIVAALDADQYEGVLFYAMEYVEGSTLDEVLRQRGGKLPPAEACDYARQAALGLQHAHECGMVHRDIKPHNLMLTADGTVKILDFGLAKVTSRKADLPGITVAGILMGTPDYMAPEQIRDPQGADIRADIYSLGFTLYSLLAGEPPYAEATGIDKYAAHVDKSRRPKPLTELGIPMPSKLAAIFDRMTAKDPSSRIQTPKEVAEELQPFASGGPPHRFPVWVAVGAIAASLLLAYLALGPYRKEKDSVPPINSPPQQAKGKSEKLTTAAWLEFKKGETIVTEESDPAKRADAIPHFKEAIRQAGFCIDEFEEAAMRMQETLTQSGATIPNDRVAGEAKEAVFRNWAVNDVGTCLFIKGRSSEYLLEIECTPHDQDKANAVTETLPITGDKAKQLYDTAQAAYQKAAALTHARCWDPDQLLFFCPSESAGDGLKRLKKKYTKP